MVESVVIKSEPTGPTAPAPEGQGAADNSQRPGWLPEKFESPEKLAEAYTNLEKEFSRRNQTPKNEAPAPANDTPGTEGDDEGVDYGVYQEALASAVAATLTGEDPAEALKALYDAGIPEDFVDQLVQGQVALVKQTQEAIYKQVGGEDAYKNMMEWGLANLSDADRNAFDAALTRSEEDAFMAVQALAARYQTATGRDPKLVQSSGLGGGVEVYESVAQMKTDMRDPRYKSDPAFRAKVEAKLARSNIL